MNTDSIGKQKIVLYLHHFTKINSLHQIIDVLVIIVVRENE